MVRRSTASVVLALLLLGWGTGVQALVDPQVDPWHDMVQAARQVCVVPGSELLPEALDELGGLASSLMKAPLEAPMQELEKRRGLTFRYFTPWHVKNRNQLKLWFEKQLAKEYTPAKTKEITSILVALGLVGSDFKLLPFLEELLTAQVAGVYDPDDDQFFLVDMASGRSLAQKATQAALSRLVQGTGLAPADQTAIVTIHELDHALGGQHFPLLKRFGGGGMSGLSTDEQMAAQALVEGDATFVMIDAANHQDPKLAGENTYVLGAEMMAKLVSMAAAFPLPLPGMAGFAQAPLYFQRSLMFPYFHGAEYVSELRHRQADWGEVNEAYAKPPQSTQEILHPGRLALKLRVPDFSKLPIQIGDFTKVAQDVGGEFLLCVVLEQYDVANFATLASGWNGDRLRVYQQGVKGPLAFLWVINWATPSEALAFRAATRDKLPFRVEVRGSSTFLSKGFSSEELSIVSSSFF